MRLGTVADVASATRKDGGDGLDLRFTAVVFPSIRRHWLRPSLLLLRVLLSVRLTTMVLGEELGRCNESTTAVGAVVRRDSGAGWF
nr:hypothetical protein Itr_chr11CG17130 [Ipomoea trifida]